MTHLQRVSMSPPGFLIFGIGLTFEANRPVYVCRKGTIGNTRPVFADIARLVRAAVEARTRFSHLAISAETLGRLWAEKVVRAEALDAAQQNERTISMRLFVCGAWREVFVYSAGHGGLIGSVPYTLCDASGRRVKRC